MKKRMPLMTCNSSARVRDETLFVALLFYVEEGFVGNDRCRALEPFLGPAQVIIDLRDRAESGHVVQEERTPLAAPLQTLFQLRICFCEGAHLDVCPAKIEAPDPGVGELLSLFE